MHHKKRTYLAVTRTLDLVLLAVSAPIYLPVLILSALLCLLTQGPPIFFVQTRVGRGGASFRILKFRTMIRDADSYLDGSGNATRQRVTYAGRFLRRSGLDELPQLINVWRGDMSLVGPRPVLPEWINKIPHGSNHPRFSLRPGLTGPAQVAGRNTVMWSERLRLDEDYCERPKVGSYFRVLSQTPMALMRPTVAGDRNPHQVDDLGGSASVGGDE